MTQSIKEFVNNNNKNTQMVNDLVDLLGVNTVSQLSPKFIEYINKVRKNIEKDLNVLTPNEGIEYLTLLLISYVTQIQLKLERIKNERES